MIASFNRGYRGFQQTYRTCTPAADLVIRRYLDEGATHRPRDHRALRELTSLHRPCPGSGTDLSGTGCAVAR